MRPERQRGEFRLHGGAVQLHVELGVLGNLRRRLEVGHRHGAAQRRRERAGRDYADLFSVDA